MGKKKQKMVSEQKIVVSGGDSENACSQQNPPLMTAEIIGPAILPPGASEHWDACLLGCTKCDPVALRGDPDLGLFTLSHLLTNDECLSWIRFGETQGFEEVGHPAGGGYAHRDNGRIVVDDQEIADNIFLRLKPFIPAVDLSDGTNRRRPTGCATNLRLYRYRPGQRFGKHVDGSHNGSEFTVLLYLNGGEEDSEEMEARLTGGETVFYNGRNDTEVCGSFAPRAGWALFHRHGDACLTHEGKAPTTGVKYLLRTDIVFG